MDKRVYQFDDVDLHSESPKAFHCEIGESMFWVPKSQIKQYDFDAGIVVTTSWWADISGAADAFESYLLEQQRRRAEEERARQRAKAESDAWDAQRRPAAPVVLNKSQAVYRKLALKYHPDKSPDTAEVMRDLNELWQAVGHDVKDVKDGR